MESVGRLNSLGDALCRFYTTPEVSSLLVSLMQKNSPKQIVDLGAGAGALSFAAIQKWRSSKITTVDIDEKCEDILKSHFLKKRFNKHFHYVSDALDQDLPEKLISGKEGFDTAICNPPYIQLTWKEGFAEILQDAGLGHLLRKKHEITVDTLFLAQNIRLVRPGGQIGLLIPDGIITGYRMVDLRRALLDQHSIDAVVQLPRRSFLHTDAQAYILIFSKHKKPKETIQLSKFEPSKGLLEEISISRSDAENRMDYDFYALMHSKQPSKMTLNDLEAQIVRGSLTSVDVRKNPKIAFHTSNFPKKVGQKVSLNDLPHGKGGDKKGIIAQKGDILLARVGRSLHLKVAYVQEGQSFISDCVYRIRVQPKDRAKVLKALSSSNGSSLLLAASHGVGAKVLSKRDLLALPLV